MKFVFLTLSLLFSHSRFRYFEHTSAFSVIFTLPKFKHWTMTISEELFIKELNWSQCRWEYRFKFNVNVLMNFLTIKHNKCQFKAIVGVYFSSYDMKYSDGSALWNVYDRGSYDSLDENAHAHDTETIMRITNRMTRILWCLFHNMKFFRKLIVHRSIFYCFAVVHLIEKHIFLVEQPFCTWKKRMMRKEGAMKKKLKQKRKQRILNTWYKNV